MKKIYALLGLIFALGIGAEFINYAHGQAGGFPSFPTFLGATVNNPSASGVICPTSGNSAALCVQNVTAASYVADFEQTAATGNGLQVLIGTQGSASGIAFLLGDQADTHQYMRVNTVDGGIQLGSPTGSGQGVGTVNATGSIYKNGTNVAIGAHKAALTSRTSTAVEAIDPDLQFNVGIGFYTCRATMFVSSSATGATPGFRFNVALMGTATQGLGRTVFTDNTTQVTVPIAPLMSSQASGDYLGNITTASQVNVVFIDYTVTVTAAGTLGVGWAQQTSSATATTMNAASSFYCIGS